MSTSVYNIFLLSDVDPLFKYIALGYHCPILLTFQIHTDYTVSTHAILIVDKYPVMFVKCMNTNQQLDVFFIVLSVANS